VDLHAPPRGAIRILDDDTIAHIAAGEVIERPASVVKELVENSLDAGAKSIAVELEDGGRVRIAVHDDGVGIERDDLPLALARHATSKLATPQDLFAVRTLGFRGEGLASIAAAGLVEVLSRTRGDEFGSRIEANGTRIGAVARVPAPPGTSVVVRDLFARTPARRQFLKNARAEFARVGDYLNRLALGWPHVTLRLRHNGRDVWTLPAAADPRDRVELAFGPDSRGQFVPIADRPESAIRVTGFISRPGRDRPNRNQQTFFVNGRLVRSAALAAAWLAGYGSFGMTGRFPFGVIAVALPPDEVDVNVHPTKMEVRFANPAAVFDAVRHAITATLRATPIVSPLSAPFEPAMDRISSHADRETEGEPASSAIELQEGIAQPASIRVFGQIDQTYIAAADASGLLVIDQHAAHERIAYEALQARSNEAESVAALLFPTVVELSPQQATVLHEHEDELAAAGIRVEAFGESEYRITGLPAGYERRRFDLAGMLDDLTADDAPREGFARRNRVLATIACHSVVRAHEPLAVQEQLALYERLVRCREPHTCPHGRPTMLRMDAATLAKAFSR